MAVSDTAAGHRPTAVQEAEAHAPAKEQAKGPGGALAELNRAARAATTAAAARKHAGLAAGEQRKQCQEISP
ncbi:hypothetical protein [Streptomyces sp. NPDC029721]|uniref:hypothetical protein n=1 Tax=Streptomyces sp. NPDC029721 TaxID=3157090 RepID=UPI0033C06772